MAQSPEELLRKARERMAARRQTPEYREWLEQSRELRRQLKEKYRREAGARPREEIAAEAEQRRARQEVERQARHVERQERLALHDAHVRRYRDVLSWRKAGKRQWELNPEPRRKRQAKRRAELVDAYVRQLLRSMGIPDEAMNERLMELKREAVTFRRLARQIRNEISNQGKEPS